MKLTVHVTTDHPDAVTITTERAKQIAEDLDFPGNHNFNVEVTDWDEEDQLERRLAQWLETGAR